MSQVSDYVFDPDVARNAFKSPLEAVFDAIKTLNSGTVAPSSPAAGMLWLDTSVSPPAVRIRNGANSGWIEIIRLTTTAGVERLIDPTIMRSGTGGTQVRDNTGLDARYLQIADARGVYSYSAATDGYLFHKVSPTKALGVQWLGIAGSSTQTGTWPIAFSTVYRATCSIDTPDNTTSANIRFANILELTETTVRIVKRTYDGGATAAVATAFGVGEITI